MRTIKDVETITVKIEDKDLIEGKYIPYNIVSKKLAEIEKENNYGYKSLRNRIYNYYDCKIQQNKQTGKQVGSILYF